MAWRYENFTVLILLTADTWLAQKKEREALFEQPAAVRFSSAAAAVWRSGPAAASLVRPQRRAHLR